MTVTSCDSRRQLLRTNGARGFVERAAGCAGKPIGHVWGDSMYGSMATRRELSECVGWVVAETPPLPIGAADRTELWHDFVRDVCFS
jgi:hypothetical protein